MHQNVSFLGVTIPKIFLTGSQLLSRPYLIGKGTTSEHIIPLTWLVPAQHSKGLP